MPQSTDDSGVQKDYYLFDRRVAELINSGKRGKDEAFAGRLHAFFQESGLQARLQHDSSCLAVIAVKPDQHMMVQALITEKNVQYSRFNEKKYDPDHPLILDPMKSSPVRYGFYHRDPHF